MIADLFYLLHPMSAENDRRPPAGQPIDLSLDEVGVHRIKPAEWLVEYDQAWLVQDGDHKLQLLTHALAEVFYLFGPPGLHLEADKPFLHLPGRLRFAHPF